jgi:hypothetical protein
VPATGKDFQAQMARKPVVFCPFLELVEATENEVDHPIHSSKRQKNRLEFSNRDVL